MKKIIIFLVLFSCVANLHAMKRKHPTHEEDILTLQSVKKQRIEDSDFCVANLFPRIQGEKPDFLSNISTEIQDIIVSFIIKNGYRQKAIIAAKTIGNISCISKKYHEKINKDSDKIIDRISSNFLCPKENITFHMASSASLTRFKLQNKLQKLCCSKQKVSEKALVKLIKKGVDLEFTYTYNYMQQTPLMMSMYHSHNGMYDLLLKHKANINGHNAHRWTIAHLAMHHRHLIGYIPFKKIISNINIDLNKKNRRENTPLLVLLNNFFSSNVITDRDISSLEQLLNAGADPEIPSKFGITPLSLSMTIGSADIINTIVEAIDAKRTAASFKETY